MALRSNCMWRLNPKLRQNCIHALESQGNESQVSKKTLLTVHCLPRTGLDRTMKKVTGYLISVRNPITRAVSSFNMGHPDNKSSRLHKKKILPASVQEFYVDCFPTIEHIAKTLQKGVQDLTQTEQECYQIGVRVLSGFGVNETAGHLAMNYAHYNRMVVTKYPGRDMWILRTQYLWEDLSRVDKLLGGNGFFVHAGKAETHQSEMHTVSQGLSRNGTRTFCCFLASELQIYEDWLRRAVNLSPSEKDGTMVEIYNSCGVPTSDLNKNTSFRWIDWAKNDPMCSSYHRWPVNMFPLKF